MSIKPDALADPAITEYSTPGYFAYHFAPAADGSMVFIKRDNTGFGSITPAGTVNNNAYSDPYQTSPQSLAGLTTGPDGNFWFTDGGSSDIYRLSPSGSITQYPISTPGYGPSDITTGPDGNLWFIEQGGNSIGSITTAGISTIYPIPPYVATDPISIASGPDGALWFTTDSAGQSTIGRVTTSGTFNSWYIPSPYFAGSITAGADGAMWFTEPVTNKIGRITSNGSITEYTVPTLNSEPANIISGPDGVLWFTESNGNSIGRITTSGSITEYPIPTPNSEPESIAVSSDGTIWFSESNADKIGRLSFAPSAPTNLSAASPVSFVNLTWDAVSGAISYNVYRDGVVVGSAATNSYTDTAATEGTHSYYVTAVNSSGESGPSNTVNVVVDQSAPNITNAAFSTNPKSISQTSDMLTATVSDNLSGVRSVEYYDPIQASWQPMSLSGSTVSAAVNFNSLTYPAGMYIFQIRATDNAGNVSAPANIYLDVYDPSGGYAAGHGFITPNGSTSNPGDNLPTETGNNVRATLDFTVQYADASSTTPTGSSVFSWGSNCNKKTNSCFVINTDSFAWLIVPSGNYNATFQGLATLSQSDSSLGSDYPVRVTVFDGGPTNTPSHYLLQVYQMGADPDTDTLLYQASGDLTGGQIKVHN